MKKLRLAAVSLGVVALLSAGTACGGDEASPETAGLSPLAPEQVVPAPPETIAEPGEQVSSGKMVARPESVEVLVKLSHVIVLGTIISVLGERLIGAYGEDGQPTSGSEEGGTPYTDYEVRIESVLKSDGTVEGRGTLVLRMFGHLSGQKDVVMLAAMQLPQPGGSYMLALGRNPDGTYGSGNEGLILVDGDTVAYADGITFSTELNGEQFVEAVEREAAR